MVEIIPPFDPKAALSSFTTSSSVRISDGCVYEQEITGPNRGNRFICVALLYPGLFKHYKACSFNGTMCLVNLPTGEPVNNKSPTQKGDDLLLPIEKKWKDYKTLNGLK